MKHSARKRERAGKEKKGGKRGSAVEADLSRAEGRNDSNERAPPALMTALAPAKCPNSPAQPFLPPSKEDRAFSENRSRVACPESRCTNEIETENVLIMKTRVGGNDRDYSPPMSTPAFHSAHQVRLLSPTRCIQQWMRLSPYTAANVERERRSGVLYEGNGAQINDRIRGRKEISRNSTP
jgi:hypothetical protein